MKELPQRTIRSVERALEVLGAFSFARHAMTVEELSSRLGLPLSSAYRFVATLRKAGFLTYRPADGRCQLGVRVFELGAVVQATLDVREKALPFMQTLSRSTGQSVFLFVPAEKEAICIEKVEGRAGLQITLGVGERVPYHTGAVAQVLLAHREDLWPVRGAGRALQRVTPRTVTDPRKLLQKLQAIRAQGYAYSDQELETGSRAIAAPIRNIWGQIVAAMGLAGAVHAFHKRAVQEWTPLVREYAEKISAELGYGRSGAGEAPGPPSNRRPRRGGHGA